MKTQVRHLSPRPGRFVMRFRRRRFAMVAAAGVVLVASSGLAIASSHSGSRRHQAGSSAASTDWQKSKPTRSRVSPTAPASATTGHSNHPTGQPTSTPASTATLSSTVLFTSDCRLNFSLTS